MFTSEPPPSLPTEPQISPDRPRYSLIDPGAGSGSGIASSGSSASVQYDTSFQGGPHPHPHPHPQRIPPTRYHTYPGALGHENEGEFQHNVGDDGFAESGSRGVPRNTIRSLKWAYRVRRWKTRSALSCEKKIANAFMDLSYYSFSF